MKQLFAVLLSTAGICAFVSTTPVTAEPRNKPSHGPGNGYDYDPVGAVGAILATPFEEITGGSPNTTQPDAGRPAPLDSDGSQGEYRGVP